MTDRSALLIADEQPRSACAAGGAELGAPNYALSPTEFRERWAEGEATVRPPLPLAVDVNAFVLAATIESALREV